MEYRKLNWKVQNYLKIFKKNKKIPLAQILC